MSGFRCKPVSLSFITPAVAVIAFLFPSARAGELQDSRRYQDLLASGDLPAAVEVGAGILDSIKQSRPGSPALASIDSRIAAINDAVGLAVFKLSMIARPVGSRRSPFLLVAPTPVELLKRAQDRFVRSAPAYAGLDEDCVAFAKSYIDVVLLVGDRKVVDAYKQSLDAGVAGELLADARAYLTAYFIGSHDESTYPAALALVGKALNDGKLPLFLADDALARLSDVRAASEVMNVLDSVPWAAWPPGEEIRLLKAMATLAEKQGETQWVIVANNKILAKSNSPETEDAQLAVIRNYAEKVKDYAAAASACADYLERFPAGKEVLNVEMHKIVYEYQGADYDAALADLKSFKEKRAGSPAIASMLVIEGLIYTAQGKTDDAIIVFAVVPEKYPKSTLAGKAEFYAASALLRAQRYAEARDRFQRVVDFYPNDSSAPEAKSMLERLKKLNIDGSK